MIRVYDVGVDGGRAYLVTQIVANGRTLTQWLSERPSLSVLLRRFVALTDALSEVHAQGILHRDIKPDNILVDQEGNFLLADFGLAALSHELTASSGFEGTPAFLPPEVQAGAPASRRADVYSLCASLWFAVCGQPAPHGTPPPALRRLFRVGLASNPEARFTGAASLARALEAALQPPAPWRLLAVTLGIGTAVAVAVLSPATQASDRSNALPASEGEQGVGRIPALEQAQTLYEAERFESCADLITGALRTERNPDARVRLNLALGRARYAADALIEAEHILESAFFRASASGDSEVASEAALLRLEVGLSLSDMQAAATWTQEAAIWIGRRAAQSRPLNLRLAVAESKRLVLVGRFEEALARLPTSPASAELPRDQVEFWFQRAKVLNRLRRAREGKDAFRTASEIADAHFPAAHRLRRASRWNLAVSLFEHGAFSEAAAEFEAVLDATQKVDAPSQVDVAELHRNLAGVYYELGDIEQSLAHAEAAFTSISAALGPTHDRTLDALGNLAVILHADGQDTAAQDASWRAVVTAGDKYGEAHPKLVPFLSNLAVMESDAGSHDEAEALLRQAERILESQADSWPREMAQVQTNLARTLSAQGESAAALSAGTAALELLEEALGPEHPELAEPLLLLAGMSLDAGRDQDAAALALRTRTLPEITTRRRARAALVLAELDARDLPAPSQDWLTVAEAELAQSSTPSDPGFTQVLARLRRARKPHNGR